MFIKGCACCGRMFSQTDWDALPFVGFQTDDVESLELRTCACKTTLALKVYVDQSSSPPVVAAASSRPRAPDTRKDTAEPCIPASYYWPPIFFSRKAVAHPSA